MSASESTHEIPLFEISGIEIIGDQPMDGSSNKSDTPPHTNQIRAYTASRSLVILVNNNNLTTAIVRNFSGDVVENTTFVNNNTTSLESGDYSLEIQSGSLTLIGDFTIE